MKRLQCLFGEGQVIIYAYTKTVVTEICPRRCFMPFSIVLLFLIFSLRNDDLSWLIPFSRLTDSTTSLKGHYKSQVLEEKKNSKTAVQKEQDVSLSLLLCCFKDSPEYCVISVYCVIDQYSSVTLMDCIASIDLKHMSEFTTRLAQKCTIFKKRENLHAISFINWDFDCKYYFKRK